MWAKKLNLTHIRDRPKGMDIIICQTLYLTVIDYSIFTVTISKLSSTIFSYSKSIIEFKLS